MDTIRVLTSIFSFKAEPEYEDNLEWFIAHPEKREKTIQDCADIIIDDLMEDEPYTGIYDSFSDKDVDTSINGGKVILGVEQPEKLIRECEDWNESLRADVAYWLKKCESHVPEGENLLSWVQTTDFATLQDAPWFMLAGALASMDGSLNDKSNRFICDVEVCDKNHSIHRTDSTVMDPEILASVKAHPEYYAIIELAYR